MRRPKQEVGELASIMHTTKAKEWEVTLQIDKVESTRSALRKARTLMLYRMHKKLTSEQQDDLHAIWERRHPERLKATGEPR